MGHKDEDDVDAERVMGRCRKRRSNTTIGDSKTLTKNQETDLTKWREIKMKDMTALQLQQNYIMDSVFRKVITTTTSNEVWIKLQEAYQGNERVILVRLQSLYTQFENLRMKDGERIRVYTDRVMDITNQMEQLGEGKKNFEIIRKILITMPKSYATLAALMEETKDLRSISVTDLVGYSLIAHESKFLPDEEGNSQRAFPARSKNHKGGNEGLWMSNSKGKKWCGYCKKDNHVEEECYFKNKDKQDQQVRRSKECYTCGKVGHLARDCRRNLSHNAQVTQTEGMDENYLRREMK
ncbi:PREDICTED: uncharacterized protein LOC104809079 [Tarenaya hassleriana]|uniref:uncharacterized protein LOC104809079 n=1 Tax=Tarenaya hassleriana TaxID=28532 RepID=UPI00053C1F4A|nr:PREDICTED: uncharacterized protein LOC104809079 [Tarenaya hassleriana]